jgi:hypothetical protein
MIHLRRLSLMGCGLLAVGLVLVGLSVEAVDHAEVSRAQRALPGALARPLALPATAAEHHAAQARAHWREARAYATAGAHARGALSLEETAALGPTAQIHGAASLAWLAADQGERAARHAQLAARLAPADTALAGHADRMVDLALLHRFRPATRIGGALGLLALLAAVAHVLAARRDRRRLERFLDAVSVRLRFSVDGESVGPPLELARGAASLTLDVFLGGRYGIAAPRRPRRAPTLHVTFSHAASNRTLRLRPMKHVRDSAVRIRVREETLARLLERPGRWRVHVRLGPRQVASATADVIDRPALRAARSPRTAALA